MAIMVLSDRYKLLTVVGDGGFATVYRALDTVLDVERAVKVLEPPRRGQVQTPRQAARSRRRRKRFLVEARAMARVDHPHILRVYDLGRHKELDYVVMELAEGGSLGDRLIHGGPLAASDAVRYAVQVLSGLSAAHEAGVIHRDIKPHNILLSRAGSAMLCDFGVARLVDDPDRYTQAGATLGTLAFMSPEQRRDAHSVGPPADVFGMCATLYQLLTRQSPVDLAFAEASSPRWSLVPEVLAPVLRKGMRPNAPERYPTAQALADALMEAVDLDPGDAFPHPMDPTHSQDDSPLGQADTLLISVDEPGSLLDLRERYREGLAEHLHRLLEARQALHEGQEDAPDRLRALAHALRGSGATYGFPAISTAAAALEDGTAAQLRVRADVLVGVLRQERDQVSEVGPRQVLVIDPTDQVVPTVTEVLSGLEVVHLRAGAQVAQHLDAPLALVVCDLHLPDMDGRELLVQLRQELPRAVPLVATAAVRGPLTRAECYALGADAFLDQPLDPDHAGRTLRAVTRPQEHPPPPGQALVLQDRMQFRMSMAAAREGSTALHRPYCVAMVVIHELMGSQVSLGPGALTALTARTAAALHRGLRDGVVLTRWEQGVVAALLPQVDASGAELELNVVLAEYREFYRAEEVPSDRLTLSAAVVEPGLALVSEALHLVRRTAEVALHTGPWQVVATTAEVPALQRVALAEDDDDMAAMVVRLLSQEGLEAVRFASGDALLAQVDQVRPHVILLDVNMPGSSGFEVLRDLRSRARYHRTPVVMLTSLGQEHHVVLGFDLGADDYILKPFSATEFTARIRRQLSRVRGPR